MNLYFITSKSPTDFTIRILIDLCHETIKDFMDLRNLKEHREILAKIRIEVSYKQRLLKNT